jgi:hypothetical protein
MGLLELALLAHCTITVVCICILVASSYLNNAPTKSSLESDIIYPTLVSSSVAFGVLLIVYGVTKMVERVNLYEPRRATWNEVVRRADRGRTVRLADLTEAQDPVSLDSFEEGDQIALLPAGTRRTPFHLNSVRRMRDTHPFSHPMTRQRMRNENIEVVRITKEKKTK